MKKGKFAIQTNSGDLDSTEAKVPKSSIERYFGAECISPAIKAIGVSRQIAARSGFSSHSHQCFELCLITKGQVQWWVEEEEFALSPGSIYLTKPGEQHGCAGDILQPCTLSWMQVDLLQVGGGAWREAFLTLTPRTWLGADLFVPQLAAILTECKNPQADSRARVKAHLTLFLTSLLRHHRHIAIPNAPQNTPLTELLAWLDEPSSRWPKVSDLVRVSGFSRSRLHELFLTHYGQSPGGVLTAKRLQVARERLLGSTDSITKIALDLDYSSSQHFASAFKKFYGLSPSAMRNLVMP